MTDLRTFTLTALCLAGVTCVEAQTVETVPTVQTDSIADTSIPQQWNLQTCIDYALQHNITIRRNRISAQSTQEDVKTAKADLFPSLNASVSQRVVNRPNTTNGTIISGDNITTSQSKTSYNGSYGIDANWTLYNGGKRLNTIKQQQLSQRIADLAVAESENSIEESIMQVYVQILYAAEAVKINEATLEVSQAQYERGKQLFEAGSIAQSDLAQLDAQVSSDNYQLVTSQATLQDYKLQLKQLLELDGSEEMNLDMTMPDDTQVLSPLPTKADVYRTALLMRPEIESGKLDVESSDLNIKIARAVKAEKLAFLTDIEGVYKDPSDPSTLISELRVDEAKKLMDSGYIGGGMLPKLQNCIDAIEAGVSRVHILDGRIPHCLLLEIFTNKGIGTAILNSEESRYYHGE